MCWVGNKIKAAGKQVEHNTNNRDRRRLLGLPRAVSLGCSVGGSRCLWSLEKVRLVYGNEAALLQDEVGAYQRVSGVLSPGKGALSRHETGASCNICLQVLQSSSLL